MSDADCKSPVHRRRRWLLPVGMVLCAVAVVAVYNRQLHRTLLRRDLPVKSVIAHDLSAVERSGSVRRFSELRGKVVACAYVYTVCPHGCAAVVGEMKKLYQKFGDRSDFHLVSVTVVPEHDTLPFLQSYAEGLGLKPADPWWFLTGDPKLLKDFMEQDLRLTPSIPIPPEERLNPLDYFEHDLRVVLIDKRGCIRGYYSVFHPQQEIADLMCQRLREDAGTLLDE